MEEQARAAMRKAHAVVGDCGPGWEDLTMLLLLAHGCGPPDKAREARERLVAWASGRLLPQRCGDPDRG